MLNIPQPAGSLYPANLSPDVGLEIFDLLVITQPTIPTQIRENIVKFGATPFKDAGIDAQSLAILYRIIFTAFPTSFLGR